MVKYYILNGQVIYNTWASNIMLCAKQCKSLNLGHAPLYKHFYGCLSLSC